MKIKTYSGSINALYDDFDDRVNKWLKENYEEIVIKDIKYSVGDKLKSVCIIYSDTEDIVSGNY